MKIVIIGVGGMGAISLSKIIAEASMAKGLYVKSTENHGMAKKGGLVETYMKINEGLSPYIQQGSADFAIVLETAYSDYAKAFLKKSGILIELSNTARDDIVDRFGDVKFANSFILGRFIKSQTLFSSDDMENILKNFKNADKNISAFKMGVV